MLIIPQVTWNYTYNPSSDLELYIYNPSSDLELYLQSLK